MSLIDIKSLLKHVNDGTIEATNDDINNDNIILMCKCCLCKVSVSGSRNGFNTGNIKTHLSSNKHKQNKLNYDQSPQTQVINSQLKELEKEVRSYLFVLYIFFKILINFITIILIIIIII